MVLGSVGSTAGVMSLGVLGAHGRLEILGSREVLILRQCESVVTLRMLSEMLA
jgi:hypothetical protein